MYRRITPGSDGDFEVFGAFVGAAMKEAPISAIIDKDDFVAWLKANKLEGAIHSVESKTATVQGNGVVLHAKVHGMFFEEQRLFCAQAVAWTTNGDETEPVAVRALTAALKINGRVVAKNSIPHGGMVSTGIAQKQTKDKTPPSATGHASCATPELEVETEAIFARQAQPAR